MNKANEELLDRIRQLKAEHPLWGYRRVWAYLRHRQNLPVNHKRIYRLMKLHGLLVPRNAKLRATRTPTKSKPKTVEPNRIWGTDMTKILIPGHGWVYLHVVLDWGSKKLVGWSLCDRSRTEDWLSALHQGLNNQFPEGIRNAANRLMLVTDNGCQPTSKRFAGEIQKLNIEHIFTSFCNPKGNADTERLMRTIKEDLVWPRDWTCPNAFRAAFEQWVQDYNEDFPHSSLGYMTPYQYEEWFNGASAA